MSAVVDGDYSGPVTLTADSPLKAEGETQKVVSIRPVLVELAEQLQRGVVPAVVQAQLAKGGKTAAEVLGQLQAFLVGPLPAQTISWTVATPMEKGAFMRSAWRG